MASAYDVGTRAWQPDAAEGWVASELINKTVEGPKVKLEFQLENGEVRMLADSSRLDPLTLLDQSCHCDGSGLAVWR